MEPPIRWALASGLGCAALAVALMFTLGTSAWINSVPGVVCVALVPSIVFFLGMEAGFEVALRRWRKTLK